MESEKNTVSCLAKHSNNDGNNGNIKVNASRSISNEMNMNRLTFILTTDTHTHKNRLID